MGFFKKLFKRKKGGTFFGNLLRKASSVATGGILGSGVGLAAWEAKQEQKDMQALQAAQEKELKAIQQRQAAINKAKNQLATSDAAAPIANAGAKAWIARNWKKLLIPIALIVGIVMYRRRNKNKRSRVRRRR